MHLSPPLFDSKPVYKPVSRFAAPLSIDYPTKGEETLRELLRAS